MKNSSAPDNKVNREELKTAVIDILKFIQKYPKAKHTLEGIGRFWLLQQKLEEKAEIVQAAVNVLLEYQILEQVLKEDLEYYYRVNQNKIDEITSFLENMS